MKKKKALQSFNELLKQGTIFESEINTYFAAFAISDFYKIVECLKFLDSQSIYLTISSVEIDADTISIWGIDKIYKEYFDTTIEIMEETKKIDIYR